MAEIRDALGLDRDHLRDYSTIYKSFDRLKCGYGGRCCLFQRSSTRSLATQHSTTRSSTAAHPRRTTARVRKHCSKLKVTRLTDRESLAVLDVHISARWKHDIKTGPQVVRRNADDLLSVAADKVSQNWVTKYEFYALGVEPLISQRGSRPLTLGHNALIQVKGHSQRWMAETSYSTTKRSLGDDVRALGWYRQFREIVHIFAISNHRNTL